MRVAETVVAVWPPSPCFRVGGVLRSRKDWDIPLVAIGVTGFRYWLEGSPEVSGGEDE